MTNPINKLLDIWLSRPHFFPRGRYSVPLLQDIWFRLKVYKEWLFPIVKCGKHNDYVIYHVYKDNND